jgi:hypothetical protein
LVNNVKGVITFLRQTQASLDGVKPHRIGVPVYPSHSRQEWQNIMAAQKQSPENFPVSRGAPSHNQVIL